MLTHTVSHDFYGSPVPPGVHGKQGAGTQGDRGGISREFQLVVSVPPTLLESMLTNYLQHGRRRAVGQDWTLMAKDLPGKFSRGSRTQARIAALAVLSMWGLRPFTLPKE